MSKAKKLTPRQEAFCIAIVKGSSLVDAYKDAGFARNSSNVTATKDAKRLMNEEHIGKHIAKLRAPVVAQAQVTLGDHLQDLKDLRDAAVGAGEYSPAIAAEVARGKASGLYVTKTDLRIPGLAPGAELDLEFRVKIVRSGASA